MTVYDITGSISNGMWNYEHPYPDICITPLSLQWNGMEFRTTVIKSMHIQTGTYLETPAHYGKLSKQLFLQDISLESLIAVDAVVLHPALDEDSNGVKRAITKRGLLGCKEAGLIRSGMALFVESGWAEYWDDKDVFTDLSKTTYISLDAMEWICSKDLFLLGSDMPFWENPVESKGVLDIFYRAGILMLSPCVGLKQISGCKLKLTALPMKLCDTVAAPCRAVIVKYD